MRKAIFPIFMAAAMTACAQPTTISGDKSMLNEIYGTKITNVATQRSDISSTVSKYLPVGTSRSKALAFLNGLGEGKIDESANQLIYSTHQGEGIKGNRRDIHIKIQFNAGNNIDFITSYIDKSNNL
jgi:hypothetical protein